VGPAAGATPAAGCGRNRSLLVPYPAEAMEAYPVSPAVNAVGNDDAQLVLPLADAARP
jgi:putative SOS response-associated peptidase YedK